MAIVKRGLMNRALYVNEAICTSFAPLTSFQDSPNFAIGSKKSAPYIIRLIHQLSITSKSH